MTLLTQSVHDLNSNLFKIRPDGRSNSFLTDCVNSPSTRWPLFRMKLSESRFAINKELLSGKGIYKITCITTDKFYIGSTSFSFFMRFRDHYYKLKNKNHVNKKLQRSFDKYGSDSFMVEIIEVIEEKGII